jgi:hypothetical protein
MKSEFFGKVDNYFSKIKPVNQASKVMGSAGRSHFKYKLPLEIYTIIGSVTESIYNKCFIELI